MPFTGAGASAGGSAALKMQYIDRGTDCPEGSLDAVARGVPGERWRGTVSRSLPTKLQPGRLSSPERTPAPIVDISCHAVRRAEGLWARLDLGSAEDAAQLRYERRLARHCAQAAFSGAGGRAAATELSTYDLQQRLPAEVGTRKQQVFGLMVNYCVIRQANPGRPEWDARWVLVDAPAEDPVDGGCTIRWSV